MNNQIENEVQTYLNANLRYQIIEVLHQERAQARPGVLDIICDHPSIMCAGLFSAFIIISTLVVMLGVFVGYKVDIAKLSEEARICNETGYGCKSDTKNTDIQYHDTPVVDINMKGGN